jgi:hypothetical protein
LTDVCISRWHSESDFHPIRILERDRNTIKGIPFKPSLRRPWRELWVTITGNLLMALSGNPQLQVGFFTDTALVKKRHYLLRLQV